MCDSGSTLDQQQPTTGYVCHMWTSHNIALPKSQPCPIAESVTHENRGTLCVVYVCMCTHCIIQKVKYFRSAITVKCTQFKWKGTVSECVYAYCRTLHIQHSLNPVPCSCRQCSPLVWCVCTLTSCCYPNIMVAQSTVTNYHCNKLPL